MENTTVAGGDLAKLITDLKNQPGGDLIVYGGGTLVANLIADQLIDELHLFVNPTAIGSGLPVFAPGAYQPLTTVAITPFDCGITALHYAPKTS
ncbi:dihydrofolate reductase family protein [Nocardia sp. CA-128927]|uniref:dihydrofolate reductase family protein n=1 Tax=Nocardia sp. CA-128927 TaxID=3239975 RepID=UPI003D99BD68